MPLDQDPGVSESLVYCSLCYRNGALCYTGDLPGFQKICYDAMRAKGMNSVTAAFFTWMIRFAPRWRTSGASSTAQRGVH